MCVGTPGETRALDREETVLVEICGMVTCRIPCTGAEHSGRSDLFSIAPNFIIACTFPGYLSLLYNVFLFTGLAKLMFNIGSLPNIGGLPDSQAVRSKTSTINPETVVSGHSIINSTKQLA